MQNKVNEKIDLGGKVRVWIGDPCYVIPGKLWDNVCEQIFAGTEREVNHIIKFEHRDIYEANVSGDMLINCIKRKLEFIQCGTSWGDGVYTGTSGFDYGVDAGCLAAVPEYLIEPKDMSEAERLGKFFEASDIVGLETDGEGNFVFYDAKGVFEIIETA
jgi:hypothetical protein